MRKPRGFTLVELIIYILILSVVGAVLVAYAIDISTTSQKVRVRQELQQEARFAIERMLQEIRAANAVNSGGSTFGSHPGVLSLTTDTPATSPTVFDVSGGVLRMTQGASPPVALTSSTYQVSNLVFTNLSVSARTQNVKITMTLRHPNPENIEIFDASVVWQGAAAIRERQE